jgi:hypothetical protein
MKLLWCVLLIGFGVREVSRTQGGNLPPSNFPPLTTDTVGALPPNQRSQRLLRVFREASHSTKLPIRFTELPDGAINTSAVETTDEEQIVALRQDLNHEQEENAIAHELFHIVLQGKGSAIAVQIPEGAPSLMSVLGFTITSCVDDAFIDRKMSKLGFEPEVLNRDTAERLRLHPPRFPAGAFGDPVFVDVNALLIVCYSFRKRYPEDEIEPTWQKLNPDVVARFHALASQIGDINCDVAQSCLAKKKRIRDVLGYPITFLNPLTKQFE